MRKVFIPILLLLASCGGSPTTTTTNTNPPPPPPVVDTKATLNWSAPISNTDGSSLTDLTNYKIYYGQSSTNLTTTYLVAGNITTAEIDNLSAGTWYFEVTAINSAGLESAPSNIVSKTIN